MNSIKVRNTTFEDLAYFVKKHSTPSEEKSFVRHLTSNSKSRINLNIITLLLVKTNRISEWMDVQHSKIWCSEKERYIPNKEYYKDIMSSSRKLSISYNRLSRKDMVGLVDVCVNDPRFVNVPETLSKAIRGLVKRHNAEDSMNELGKDLFELLFSINACRLIDVKPSTIVNRNKNMSEWYHFYHFAGKRNILMNSYFVEGSKLHYCNGSAYGVVNLAEEWRNNPEYRPEQHIQKINNPEDFPCTEKECGRKALMYSCDAHNEYYACTCGNSFKVN